MSRSGGYPGLRVLASTGTAGFALQNATPAILSYAFPSDSALHRVLVTLTLNVTAALTGGAIGYTYTDPGGTAHTGLQILAGGQAVGGHLLPYVTVAVEAGSTFEIVQTSAATAGAGTVWADIIGS